MSYSFLSLCYSLVLIVIVFRLIRNMFTVEGTGEMILRLKKNANIDYESGLRQKDCIIKASDKGKTSFSSTVTLSMILIDVNDNRPVIANPHINKSVSRDSDVGNTIIVNSIPATDADSGENGKLGYAISK